MSLIDSALNSIGINAGITDSFGAAQYGGAANLFASAVGAFTGGDVASTIGAVESLTASNGDWTAVHYANDLVNHAPKFKFLFKVLFSGFGTRDFYYYVQHVDKPRIRFNHQEVNYYNFRSKVLTSTTFEPLSVTFLDETGNSVNQFFQQYMARMSGQGSGGVGINNGFTKASSSKSYANGYSVGQSITIEQIFGNGTASNRFVFINPRIESFDFDELSMEENGGSTMTVLFHYDGLTCSTVSQSTLYSWGNTDILRGGGNDVSNGGASSLLEAGALIVQSATGTNTTGLFSSIAGIGRAISSTTDAIGSFSSSSSSQLSPGVLPASLSGLSGANAGISAISAYNQSSAVDSSGSTLSSNMQFTLNSVQSGSNLAPAASLDAGESVVNSNGVGGNSFSFTS
jgi:hypothetical protein